MNIRNPKKSKFLSFFIVILFVTSMLVFVPQVHAVADSVTLRPASNGLYQNMTSYGMGYATPTLIQGDSQGTAQIASGTFTVTLSQAPTQGNMLICCYLGVGNSAYPSISGISQTGVTWTQATAGLNFCSIWYGVVGSNAGTVATITVASGAGGSYGEVADICEWYGLVSSSPVDKTAHSSSYGGATNCVSGTTATTTQAFELEISAIGGTQYNSGTASSPQNGFTLLDGNYVSGGVWACTLAYLYKTVSVTGTASTGATFSYNNYGDGCIATFKAGFSLAHASATSDQNDATGVQVTGSTVLQETESLMPLPVLVQGPARGDVGHDVTSMTVTLAQTPQAGNTLIMCFGGWDNAPTVTNIVQTGVTWNLTPVSSQGWDAAGSCEILVGVVGSGASTSIAITIYGVGANVEAVADVCEYSGLLTSGALDKVAGYTTCPTPAATTSTGNTATTTQANELWIGCTMVSYYGQSAPTNGFTLLDGVAVGQISLAYLQKIVTSTGTANSGTTCTSNPSCGCIATFKAAIATTQTGTIASVEVHMRAEANATGCAAETLLITQGTLYSGSATSISNSAFTDYDTVYTTNPNTTATWTWSDINQLQNQLQIGAQATTLPTRDTIQFSEFYIIVNYEVNLNYVFSETASASSSISISKTIIYSPNVQSITVSSGSSMTKTTVYTSALSASASATESVVKQITYTPFSLSLAALDGMNMIKHFVFNLFESPKINDFHFWSTVGGYPLTNDNGYWILGVVFGMMGVCLAIVMPIVFMRRRDNQKNDKLS